MEKKGLLLVLAIVIVATMVVVQAVEAETSDYWQGYDLGYYHGKNHMRRVYPASAYHTDYLRGYDRGHIDGYYNRPPAIHYYEDFQGGNYAPSHPQSYPRWRGGSIPLPPLPPWFRR